MSEFGAQTVLLVNPWICDFAAYDLWIQPLGLLRIAAYLRMSAVNVHLLDLLERAPAVSRGGRDRSTTAAYGTGKFVKTEIAKPLAVTAVPRRFFRYGLSPAAAAQRVCALRPDLIMVTSGMTYWYVGVQQTIAWLRQQFPDSPIVLGGIYASLCPEHARRYSDADAVCCGSDWEQIGAVIENFLEIRPAAPSAFVWPDISLLPRQSVVVVQANRGCLFRCSYCAGHILTPHFLLADPIALFDFIQECVVLHNTADIVFYDDALLAQPERFIKPFLRQVAAASWKVRFHTPNGLHARFIDAELAFLLKIAGFCTVRLALESTDAVIQEKSDGKVSTPEIETAIRLLQEVGFNQHQLGVYALLGIPGQDSAQVRRDMQFVHHAGAAIVLSSYSLVPHTRDWSLALATGLIKPETDLLALSHTAFPLMFGGFSAQELKSLRQEAAALNGR